MSPIETQLRELIAEVVRDELGRALAQAARPDEYLDTRAAGELASVAPATIRRWIHEGKLPGHHAGRETRVRRADLESLLRVGPRREARAPTPEELAARAFAVDRRGASKDKR